MITINNSPREDNEQTNKYKVDKSQLQLSERIFTLWEDDNVRWCDYAQVE